MENQSEVARLLAQISSEYEAAQRGLHGTAQGTARHVFITARMENVGKLADELKAFMGDNDGAMALVISAMNDGFEVQSIEL